MNTNTIIGTINHRNRTKIVQVPRELLILDALSYASARAEQLRAEASDTDYTIAERAEYTRRANFLKNWATTGGTTDVPFDIDLNLFLRTSHLPTVVDSSNVDAYLDALLSVSTEVTLEEGSPQFAIMNLISGIELWLSNSPALRNARRYCSPDVEVVETTSDKIEVAVFSQSMMKETDSMAGVA